MDSDAFSEDSEASGAEVRQMRLAHSDDSSEDEEDSRDEPDTISDAEVLLNLQFSPHAPNQFTPSRARCA